MSTRADQCPRRCWPSSATDPRTTGSSRSRSRRPGPGEALVRVEAVGICASDLKCYHGAAKFWGDENRPAWAETEVIPGHEFVGEVVAARRRGRRALGHRGRGPGRRPSRSCRAGSAATASRGQYWMCAPHDMFGFKRRTPGAMARTWSSRPTPWSTRSARTCRRRTPPSPSRCRARCTRSSGPTSTFDDVVVVAGCGPIGLGMIAGAEAKTRRKVVALDMAPRQARRWPCECGADLAINIAEEDAVQRSRTLTDGYGADVYIEGTGHPSAVGAGAEPAAQAGHATWSTASSAATSASTGRSSATTRSSTCSAPTWARTAGPRRSG